MIEQRNSSSNAESFWKAQPYSSRCVAINPSDAFRNGIPKGIKYRLSKGQ